MMFTIDSPLCAFWREVYVAATKTYSEGQVSNARGAHVYAVSLADAAVQELEMRIGVRQVDDEDL